MPTLIYTPTLRCPFCASEILTLFRSKMRLAFAIVDADEKKESVPVTTLLCGGNHFFFVRSSDLRIQSSSAPFVEAQSA